MTPKQLEQLELEGTCEEIVTHSAQLAGRKVRVIVLTDEHGSESPVASTPVASVPPNRSTAATLLNKRLAHSPLTPQVEWGERVTLFKQNHS